MMLPDHSSREHPKVCNPWWFQPYLQTSVRMQCLSGRDWKG